MFNDNDIKLITDEKLYSISFWIFVAMGDIHGLAQDCSNSIANALE